MALPNYEVFAIKYAERQARHADRFIGGDAHDDAAGDTAKPAGGGKFADMADLSGEIW